MSHEIDPKYSQPERHPFDVEWLIEGDLGDTVLRFFWNVPVVGEYRRRFEETLLDEADRLNDENIIHDVQDEFKWRSRTRPKGVPSTTPRAHKVEVRADFVTTREDQEGEELEPIHKLLDALHNFHPPIILVKVEIGI